MVNRTVDIQFLAGRALATDLMYFYLEHNTLLPRHRKMVGVTTDGLNENRPANILCSISFQNYQVLWLICHISFKFILLAYTVMCLLQAFEPSCQAVAHSWVVKATNRERLSLKLVTVLVVHFRYLESSIPYVNLRIVVCLGQSEFVSFYCV